VREVIKVKSVEARSLDGGIGYVRLKQFQSTSDGELTAPSTSFRAKGPLRGLVLDLRGNPGGLLDQAAKIADKFLTDGVIVSTVGASDGREEKRAKGPRHRADVPRGRARERHQRERERDRRRARSRTRTGRHRRRDDLRQRQRAARLPRT
jgi:C-terminal processing protease CtpA/Prc